MDTSKNSSYLRLSTMSFDGVLVAYNKGADKKKNKRRLCIIMHLVKSKEVVRDVY